jgi:hypothetical protein
MRFIITNNSAYLKCEDVVNYIKLIASTEETDVRNRLTEAADNLQKINEQAKK